MKSAPLHCLSTWRHSVKKTKFWILYECKGYNAWQFMTEFLEKGWTKNSINRLLVKLGKFRTVDRHPGSGRQCCMHRIHRILMKTLTQLSRWWWVRKTNLRVICQSEKFHVRQGTHQSSVSQIIHKDLRLKCCKKRCAQQLTKANSMHTLLLVCSLTDENMSMSIYKANLHENWNM